MTIDTYANDVPHMAALLRHVPDVTDADTSPATKKIDPAHVAGPSIDPSVRLPGRIAGGLKGVSDDLERHAREWRNTYRLLEQQRPQLEAIELERERLHEALGRLAPRVHDNGRTLTGAMDSAKRGDFSGDLAGQFTRSQVALDELEGIAEALAANLLQMRSTWEQYARTVIRAQKLRDALKHDAL